MAGKRLGKVDQAWTWSTEGRRYGQFFNRGLTFYKIRSILLTQLNTNLQTKRSWSLVLNSIASRLSRILVKSKPVNWAVGFEHESNLSQEGDDWVSDNAQVFGNAHVYGNSQIYGDAQVYDLAQVYGNVQVYDYAHVHGVVWVCGYDHIFR